MRYERIVVTTVTSTKGFHHESPAVDAGENLERIDEDVDDRRKKTAFRSLRRRIGSNRGLHILLVIRHR